MMGVRPNLLFSAAQKVSLLTREPSMARCTPASSRWGREHRHGQIHLAPVQQTGDVGQVGPLVDQVDLGVLQQKMLQEGGVVRHADDGEGLGPSAVLVPHSLDAGVQE